MAHLPVNHPARPLYRGLAAMASLYLLAFGIAGLLQTRDLAWFDRGENWVLGLQTNPAFSWLSVAVATVLLVASLYDRNLDHYVYLGGAVVFLGAGLLMLAVLHTVANLLNFAVPNVIASFLIGLVLLLAGLYGKRGPVERAEAEEEFRHGATGALDRRLRASAVDKHIDPSAPHPDGPDR